MPAPDDVLNRRDLAKYLTEAGYPIALSTLENKASKGSGPPYALWLGRALYRWGDAIAWAQDQTEAPRANGAA